MNIGDETLPAGWVEASLGDLVQPLRPRVPPAGYPTLRFIGLEHVEAHRMRLLGTQPATSVKSAAVHFEPGDVLYGRLRPYLNKVFRPSFEGLCSAEFIVLPNSPHLDLAYVQYVLNSADFVSFSNRQNAGDRPRVDFDQLKGYRVSVPPCPEQHRIVAEIEKQFTRLDASLMALERVRAKLKRYRTSVLNAAVTGRLSPIDRRAPHVDNNCSGADSAGPDLPAGWSANTGGRLFNFVTSGSRGWAKYYSTTGAVFLRMGNLDHSTISLDLRRIQHVRPPASAEGLRTKVVPGDVLISITADVGMVAVAKHGIEETYINQHLALARPTGDVNPAYLGWAIASPLGQRQFEELRRGATKVGLGLDDIRSLILPVPPRPEQDQIVAEVERRLSLVEKLEAVVDDAQKWAAALRQSILKRAFEGKLVPQDPDDEPADVLLERIRAERAAMSANESAPKRAGRKKVRA